MLAKDFPIDAHVSNVPAVLEQASFHSPGGGLNVWLLTSAVLYRFTVFNARSAWLLRSFCQCAITPFGAQICGSDGSKFSSISR